ncbi:Sec34-like family-domain-containing protein [Radiomyces spectabilis]|uniref:Sec34-like family-domain-containing protein n=1 Tax=Radiomyces spectabilis TaxID=64574 RepID=UPI00221F2A4B|nr:Sec34-like family-domain-containing protein [Radiomyces spectabilis]KAI8367627.1 Sec34-like family-domain-containing protein [Radiomyces spectabilis]
MVRATRGISLEEWEEKTQLDDKQQQSVYQLQEACLELPLPSHWLFNDRLHTSPSLGVLSKQLSGLSSQPRSVTNLAAMNEANHEQMAALGAEKPVETLQQFFDWFAVMESEMEKDQEDVCRNYFEIIMLYRNACDEFLRDLDGTTRLFDELKGTYAFVEERTKSLQSTCETLLHEQGSLTKLADGLAEKLAYYNHLDPIAKLFNAPGDDICLNPQFVPMLKTLDECINYMQQHLEYRDSELYLMRFRQCMTRGMTLIKMHAVTSIKSLGYDIYKQIKAKTDASVTGQSKQTTLLYVKFKALGPSLRPLISQLESRCQGHKEYEALYRDILNAYFQTRQQLLNPIISRKIAQLAPSTTNMLTFAQNGCAYMMNLCMDEYNLARHFFRSADDELYAYLDELTSYLYDYLRPRIIHENDISTLSDLCSIFQLYVMQDERRIGTDNNSQQGLMFGHLIQHVLEDAQGKLVFRAQRFIHHDIQNYQAKPEDFDLRPSSAHEVDSTSKTSVVLEQSRAKGTDSLTHPATLTVEEDTPETPTTSTHAAPSVSSPSSSLSPSPFSPLAQGTDEDRGWFPTLQKTLWILSKLYRCVQTRVFEDLAQEAVSLCSESLKKASETIATTKSRLDSQLFLIKHFLVLKEQLAPFEANLIHASKELDFSHVTDSLSSWQQTGSLIFNPNNLISLAQHGMPRVVEISLDSRREIDREIKTVCEDFIVDCVRGATEPLATCMAKLSSRSLLSSDNASTPRISSEEILSTIEQFKEATQERLKFVTRKLREYVHDQKMEEILLKPVESNVIEQYSDFVRQTMLEVSAEPSKAPMSVEAMAVWISDLKTLPNTEE